MNIHKVLYSTKMEGKILKHLYIYSDAVAAGNQCNRRLRASCCGQFRNFLIRRMIDQCVL